MGEYGRKNVVGIRREWMSNFPCYDPIVQKSTQKQRTLETVHHAADLETIETICGIVVFANQLSLQ